ncbi:MAG: S-layer homology domain-containing protein [Candidatus Altimarinota bacterium]
MNVSTTLASLRKKVAGVSMVAIVASFFATGVATAQTNQSFNDVPPDAWFFPYVQELVEAGVVDSNFDNYRPSDLVNRAEMAKLAVEAAGLPLETASAAPFNDVPMGQWYTNYVYTAEKNGVVGGYKNESGALTGFYGPGNNLNRAEASKIIVNAFALPEDMSGAPHFPDVKSSDWFYIFVESNFNAGVVSGYPDGSFGPARNINRAEIAKMVSLAMEFGMDQGFVLESAAAASKTKVELIFSRNVDEMSAEDVDNYMVEDSTGSELAVTAAEYMGGDTVHLTTGSQTEGKVYYVTVTNVTSDADEELSSNDEVSFLGYGADVSGGDLEVALSTLTPTSGSVPQGATGVVFTCWDFMAGSDDVIVKSVHAKRVGPGSQTAFSDVYLYQGDSRLTTGRSVNSETQMVEFNNINVSVAAGENETLCLVADLTTAASGGVHAFELTSEASVMSNSSDMTASFPMRGAEQLITSATVGTTTIEKNGSLDELTISQADGRIAQFEIEADGSEDQKLERIALYVRGSVTVNDIVNLKLFVEGQSAPLATVSEVGAKDLATFKLATPYQIGRGQRKIFYVTADLAPGRDGDTIKTYLDESTDLLVTGNTFGYGTRVTFTDFDGGGTCSTQANCDASLVTIKGSAFNVAFTGPASGDIATGQKAARCLDITITNASGESVEIKDWPVTLDITNAVTGEGGLVAATADIPNYTLVKLARVNDDGSLGGSLLGPVELSATGSSTTQTLTLSGSATVDAGESIKASVVFDVRSGNSAMNGDDIRCTIAKGVTNGLAGVSDAIRDVNGDQLGVNSVTPSSAIAGNLHNVVQGALTVALASTPSSQTYTRGSANVALAGFAFTAGSSLDQSIKSLTVTGFVDGNNDGVYSAAGTGNEGGATLSNIVDSSVALYDGDTKVSDFKNINTTTGQVVFNNLNIAIAKSQTKNLTLRGNISNSAPFGAEPDRVKFAVVAGTDVIAIDQNGQNVDSTSITVDGNMNSQGTSTVAMVIAASGNGTVGSTTTASPTALAGTSEIEVAKWTFTSVNENPMLKDLDLLTLNDSAAVISNVKLYSGASCATQVGSMSGYTPKPSGIVEIRDLNVTISSSSTYTLCAKVTTNTVNSDGVSEPTSNSNVGLVLFNMQEVSSGSGENVNARYAGNAAGTAAATVGATIATGDLSLNYGAGAVHISTDGGSTIGALLGGDVLVIDSEFILVTDDSGTTPATVVRGFAGTTAASHAVGATVSRSRLSTRLAVTVDGAGGTNFDNQFVVGDVYAIALDGGSVPDATPDYCMITAIAAPVDNALDIYTVEGVFGTSTATCTGNALIATDEVAKINLHGPLSKLYRSVPQISKATASTSGAPSNNSTMLDLNVKALGDQVRFENANGNQLVVTLNSNGNLVATPSGCTLVKVGPGPEQTLDTQPILGGAASELLTFTFATNSLVVDADETYNVQVRCNASGALGVVDNASLTASLASATTTVEWSDTVDTDVTGAGQFIVPTLLTGNTVANGS